MVIPFIKLTVLIIFNLNQIQIDGLDSLMKNIQSNYKKISTVSGRVTKTSGFENNKVEFYGRFFYSKKDGLYIEYTSPEKLIFTSGKKGVSVYIEKSNRQYFLPEEEKLVPDAALNTVGYFYPNILRMFKELTPSIFDSTQDAIIIQYENTSKNSKIRNVLIKVSKTDYTLSAVELFDSDGEIFYQLIYKSYYSQGDVNYPSEISIKFLQANDIYEEEIYLNRLSINDNIPKKYFNFKPPEKTDIDTLKLDYGKFNKFLR